MSILIFDPDASLRELLKIYLEGLGHTVSVHETRDFCEGCPQKKAPCCSSREAEYADVVLVDMEPASLNAADFIARERERGCRVPQANQAVMSTGVTPAMEQAIAGLGCHHIRKPFRLAEIRDWVEACAARRPPSVAR